MRLVGYTDRWSIKPGEEICCYVSAEAERYSVTLVRLIHGDRNPSGPGLKEEVIASSANGTHEGVLQRIYSGSYLRADGVKLHPGSASLVISMWIHALLPGAGEQGVFACPGLHGSPAGPEIFINAAGNVEARVPYANGHEARLISERRLRTSGWYFVALIIDPSNHMLSLRVDNTTFVPDEAAVEIVRVDITQDILFGDDNPILLGARTLIEDRKRLYGTGCFNGKIGAPLILAGDARMLYDATVSAASSLQQIRQAARMIADWDFSADQSASTVPDRSGNHATGTLFNAPMRGVTGHRFDGSAESFRDAPHFYNAVHFHCDDLYDADWNESFRFRIPNDLKSAVYAFRLEGSDGSSDYVPFFVRRPTGRPSARIALVLPTFSYLAYANENMKFSDWDASLLPHHDPHGGQEQRAYLTRYKLKSAYDLHADGSGVCYASLLRPIVDTIRPFSRTHAFNGPHQLAADLHLIDWLDTKQISVDIFCDHDLHAEGVELLAPYACVLSGTHAEYWSGQMLDALAAYQQRGGRFIYLSGNGLYWVTTIDASGTLIEIRRTQGSRAWSAAPAEAHHSQTGEPGGLWRARGRAPQRYVGVGMSGYGLARGTCFKLTPESRTSRVAHLLEGLRGDLIGDTPSLVLEHGAVSFELDRMDTCLGTPAHAVLLASSLPLSAFYIGAVEESQVLSPNPTGPANNNVRSDMVFYETPNGGAVFSVGSIGFCATLSYNGYANNSSRLLENVIAAFTAENVLAPPSRVNAGR